MKPFAALRLYRLVRTPCRVAGRCAAAAWIALPVVPLLLAACNGLDPVATYEQTNDPAQLYVGLTFDHPAVNLSTVAPYDTFRLTATPRNALGEPMTGLPAPVFRLANEIDSTKVTVTPDGLVRALAATSNNGVTVFAELLTSEGIRHVGEARINAITTAPPQIASLSIDQLPPDDALVGMLVIRDPESDYGFYFGFGIATSFDRKTTGIKRARVSNAAGTLVAGLMVEYTSLDSLILTIARFTPSSASPVLFGVQGLRPGQARIVARTMAYGVSLVDTTVITVTWPALQFVYAVPTLSEPRFEPEELRLTPHGVVVWKNAVGDTVDVTFDDPTNVTDPSLGDATLQFACNRLLDSRAMPCGPGNIVMPQAPLNANQNPDISATLQVRQFPVPGIYHYRSLRTGATGRIIVTDDLGLSALSGTAQP